MSTTLTLHISSKEKIHHRTVCLASGTTDIHSYPSRWTRDSNRGPGQSDKGFVYQLRSEVNI